MRAVTRITMTLVGLLAASALPAMAQSFKAEVSCTGIFAPGDAVPVVANVENKTLASIPLDVNTKVQVPGRGELPWKKASFTLGPDQHRTARLTLNLPGTAPTGPYLVTITATSATEMSFDTCSFQVQ
jgi:hypothetical protein